MLLVVLDEQSDLRHADVLGHEMDRPLHVARLRCAKDRLVLGDRPAHVTPQLERTEPVPVDLRAQVPVEIRQHPVAGRVEEDEVESGVRLEESLHVSGSAAGGHLVDRALQRSDVVGRELRHGEAHRHRLQRLAHLVRLDELVARQRAHDGASARPTVTSPSAASRPIASRIGPRLTPSVFGERHLLQLAAWRELARTGSPPSGACARAARA